MLVGEKWVKKTPPKTMSSFGVGKGLQSASTVRRMVSTVTTFVMSFET
jgi:hypothetical protein